MFDLSTLKINTYDFIFEDGKKIHLKSLTQKMYIEISVLRGELNDIENTPIEKQLEINNKMILMFLNNNIENEVFTLDFVTELFDDISICNMFIDDYMSFVDKGKDNPN